MNANASVATNNKGFVGKTIEEVRQIPDLSYRITMKDGVVYAGTCDIRPGRYNFTVQNGIITSVKMG